MPSPDAILRLVDAHAPTPPVPPPAAIEANDLTFAFVRGTRVLHDVTMRVPEGATCALLGPNGAGKSTLLELCAGLHTPQHGELRVCGNAMSGSPTTHAEHVALVSVRCTPPTGFTVGALQRYVAAWHPRWSDATADALCEHFALSGAQRIDTLSFGGRMKVQLLCALAAQPRLLLLDEPFTGLDVATKDALIGGVLLADDGTPRTTVIASHDLGELELLVDHLLVLQGGRMQLAGDLDSLRAQSETPDTLRDLYVAHTTHATTRMEPAG